MEIMNEAGKKKRGRKPNNQKKEYVLNKEQTKFFVDLSLDKESLDLVFDLLAKVNTKELGSIVTFKELALIGIARITEKDIERLQENSLSEMEKVERALIEFNKKSNKNLTLGEFLVRKLNIN